MNVKTSGAATLAADQKLTAAELEQAHLYLQQTREGLVGATRGLSEEQWKFKPAPERWSIAEILEHVVIVQERVLGPIRDQLATAPGVPANYDYQQVDAIVINQFPNRLAKFQAPGFVNPSGLAPSEALDRFVKNYLRLIEFLETTPGLREHAVEAPPLKGVSKGSYGLMDGYQWILAAAAHAERHTKQILEVMAHANFPSEVTHTLARAMIQKG
jgi:hypothetical protein